MAIPHSTKSLFFKIRDGFIIIRQYADEVFEILIIIKNEIRREIIDFKNRTLADKASLVAGIIIWFHLIASIDVSNHNHNHYRNHLNSAKPVMEQLTEQSTSTTLQNAIEQSESIQNLVAVREDIVQDNIDLLETKNIHFEDEEIAVENSVQSESFKTKSPIVIRIRTY